MITRPKTLLISQSNDKDWSLAALAACQQCSASPDFTENWSAGLR